MAVVTVDGSWLGNDPNIHLTHRILGRLDTNQTYFLQGWGQYLAVPRRREVMVFGANFCDPLFPQSFCTVFESGNAEECTAEQGSALAFTGSSIDGIVLNNQVCAYVNGRFMLNYQNVDQFRGWINGIVSGSEISSKFSTILKLTIAVIIAKKFM